MNENSSAGNSKQVEDLLTAGCQITGSAIGGAMGFYLAGPIGAATAGAIGSASGSLLADIATRVLSRREKVRIGAVAEYAFAQINQNMESGLNPRHDEFMMSLAGDRSPCEEIFEGVLLKAQREHEEKKLRYLGQFYANVAFDRYCSVEQANYLLSLLNRLTYQQLVMIRTFRPLDLHEVRVTRMPGEDLEDWERELISRREEEQHALREGLLPRMLSGGITSNRAAAYAALMELFQLNLVSHEQENGLQGAPPLQIRDIDFSSTYSTTVGERIHRLCGLEAIPLEDVSELKHILDYTAPVTVYVPKEISS